MTLLRRLIWKIGFGSLVSEGFPNNFTVQSIGVVAALEMLGQSPEAIAKYFRDCPRVAESLLYESYDKRYSPSTYITEVGSRFEVGWFTRKGERECVSEFTNLADAATDYLLFSKGICRWKPSHSAKSS